MSMRDLLTNIVGDILAMVEQGAAENAARGDSLTEDQIRRIVDDPKQALKDYAVRAALEKMGLEIEAGPVTAETITAAIMAGPLAGLGLEITDIFNRDAVVGALRRVAMARAADALGMQGVSNVAGLRDGVRELIGDEVARQVAAGAGSLMDGAPDAQFIARAIKARKPDGWNAPSDFTKKGMQNRERQARWRAEHSRHWENR